MNLRKKKRKVTYSELNEGVDLHMDFDIDSNLNFRKRSNKDKLIDLCNTLDIKEKIIEIPAKGYSSSCFCRGAFCCCLELMFGWVSL